MSERTVMGGRYKLDPVPRSRGGMGEIWFGWDTQLDRQVAVKFVRLPDCDEEREEYLRRFRRESRITARLEHPGVPAVYDVGEDDDGRPFLVMQRVHGISLADLLAEHGRLPIGWAAAIAAQICAVLVAAHEKSLVHRDLKPSNVMIEKNGAVKVLDFGLAAAPTLRDFSRITRTAQPLGTPAYMAPEQVESGIASPASDLYALGCTLHEMLSGSPVFDGRTSYSVMDKQVKQPPTPLRRLRSEVPAELERLVLDLLEKDPRQRPPHARRVFERLLPFVEELAPLPEVIDLNRRECATRLYATVLTRASLGEPSGVAAPAPPRIAAAPHERPRDPASREQLTDARRRAARLVQEARYRQAAEVLTTALTTARRALGDTHQDVVDARLELADALYDGGDYHAATPVYAELAERFAGRDPDRALHCRMREAGCHALTGEPEVALRMVQKLLREEQPARPATDPKMITLRRQVGLLQRALGHRDDARRTLSELLDDLRRWYGPTHPTVVELRAQVEALSRPGRP
ncbi:MAG TPA: serine/threonine-protein kinase [Micromonospora sp.]